MKQVCLVCERTSADRNLYCQDVRCPAERSPLIFDYGELIGDITIVKPMIILRTAVVYTARRQGKLIYLKVAHPGPEHTARLQREAALLNEIRQSRTLVEQLPTLLPPYVEASVDTMPYGKIVVGQHLLYYVVFEHLPAEPLRDILRKTPQLWINHVGRIALGLAAAVAVMQGRGRLHAAISPDVALVQLGDHHTPCRVLLVDLGLACEQPALAACWYPAISAPAYTAPDLLGATPSQATYDIDVYGLGLTLYELLIGERPIPSALSGDEAIAEAVRRGRLLRMSRTDDVGPIAQIAERAVSSDRPANARQFADAITGYYQQIPVQRRRPWLRLEAALVLVAVLLAIAFMIALAVTFGAPAGYLGAAIG